MPVHAKSAEIKRKERKEGICILSAQRVADWLCCRFTQKIAGVVPFHAKSAEKDLYFERAKSCRKVDIECLSKNMV